MVSIWFFVSSFWFFVNPRPLAQTLLLTVQLHQKLETEIKKLPFQRDGTVARPPSDGDTEL